MRCTAVQPDTSLATEAPPPSGLSPPIRFLRLMACGMMKLALASLVALASLSAAEALYSTKGGPVQLLTHRSFSKVLSSKVPVVVVSSGRPARACSPVSSGKGQRRSSAGGRGQIGRWGGSGGWHLPPLPPRCHLRSQPRPRHQLGRRFARISRGAPMQCRSSLHRESLGWWHPLLGSAAPTHLPSDALAGS